MTTKQRVRDEAKMQELAAQVEALRTPETAPYVEQTLQRIREWTEGQLRARFKQIRDATLEAALRGNPKYREINMQIVCVYDCVVAFLSGYEMRLVIYGSELIYRGECEDGILYVSLDLIENDGNVPAHDLFSTAFWLHALNGELVWIAATCEACGDEFRPSDGYVETEHEPTYSYCANCCHW